MAKPARVAPDLKTLNAAVEHTSPLTRIKAVQALAMYYRTNALDDEFRPDTDNLLLKLAVDKEVAVRHALAQEFVKVKGISPDLVFSIASDVDELALPFLIGCRAINARMCAAIAKVGDEPRRAAIARRPDVNKETVQFILREGRVESIVSLLSNSRVRFSSAQFEAILETHGDERAVLDGMVRRPDLPNHLKVMMARQVSQQMRRRLNGANEDTLKRSEKKIIRAEEIALLRIASGTKPNELAHLVAYLVERKQMTPSLLLRATCRGEMDLVVEALAILSAMPAERVRNLMFAKGALSLRAVHSKASLPKALFAPLRVAVDIEAERVAGNKEKSADIFGRKMIEKVLTGYESFKPQQRIELLGMIGSYGSKAAAALASQLMEETKKAA